MFGDKADYYQTMYAIRILSEAMWRMYWDAFESWVADKDTKQWQEHVENLVQKLLENNTATSEQLEMIRKAQPQLVALNNQMQEFRKYLDNYPTAVFWFNFLDMADILHRSSTINEKATGWVTCVSQQGCSHILLQQATSSMVNSLCLCICRR